MVIIHAVITQIITQDSFMTYRGNVSSIFYFSSKWFVNINKIPINNYIIVCFLFLYLNDVGNSSYNDICIIIPAIKAIKRPIMVLFIILLKNRYASIAPNGSDSADDRVYSSAFPLLFLA